MKFRLFGIGDAVVLAVVLSLLLYFGETIHQRYGLGGWLAIAGMVLAYFAVFEVILACKFKAAVVRALSQPIDWTEATLEEFSGTARAAIDCHIIELQSLGFGKTAVLRNTNASGRALSVLLLDTAHRCAAVLYQSLPVDQAPTPVHCAIVSDLEGDRAYATTNETPEARWLGVWRGTMCTCRPGMEPRGLIHLHLQRRAAILEALGLTSALEQTLQSCMDSSLRHYARRLEETRSTPAVVFLVRYLRMRWATPHEWLGGLDVK